MLRPPRASLAQAERAAALCSDVCSAATAAAGRRGVRRGALAAPSWPRSVGSTDARLWGLAGRQAGSCLRLYGDKSIKKKRKKAQRGCFPRRGAHTFLLARLGRGGIRKPCCCWSEQRLPLSHTICMRQWDAVIISGNGHKQWGRLW